MEDLTKVNDAILMDLLVTHLNIYSSLITDWQLDTEENKECLVMIQAIQEELTRRHKAKTV